ncbi:hypothetical protein EXIGLDRAFT_724115 [Exidia glandulosa HHB12029]|uniref:Uncharacterized protein n=1 Tax=Exidia glandulosa HHB12029 TaxID=1314781 RepID=A0A165EJT1_EXIGL|nr:hypothetical protein EXIGLDRAFT_724115 [Exidia glandulosa HHB12029]
MWRPTKVELGAVGYIDKKTFSFVTLFNAYHLATTAHSTLRRAHPLCESNPTASGNCTHFQEERHTTRGDRSITQFLTGKRRYLEQYTLNAHTGSRRAYLVAPETRYQRCTCGTRATVWFLLYVQLILAVYGPVHGIEREEIILVTRKLDASDWAMALSNRFAMHDYNIRLSVVPRALRSSKFAWARFSRDANSSKSRMRVSAGHPKHRDDWPSLLLGGLRFVQDEEVPRAV